MSRPVRESDLLAFPQAHLYFPGSHVIERVGADQSPTRPGEEPNPAYVGAILTVPLSDAGLYKWYDQQLGRAGFEPTVDYRPATQVSGKAWERQRRLQVQVGTFDPARLAAYQGLTVNDPAATIVYEVALVGYAPGLPKDAGGK